LLHKVLKLTDAKVCSKIGFSLSELVNEDWKAIQSAGEEAWTQAIGRGCQLAGFEALIVPSARHKVGKNIVVFPQNLSKTSEIKILSADELPK
jgi:RES domain-containing protein